MRNRKKRSWFLFVIGLSLLVSACSMGQPDGQQEESESVSKPSVESNIIAQDLSIP